MGFTFISGAETDETEKSRVNWARVKGKAENVLRNYKFETLSLFRPAYIKALSEVKPSYSLNKFLNNNLLIILIHAFAAKFNLSEWAQTSKLLTSNL